MIDGALRSLMRYGRDTALVAEADSVFVLNRLLDALALDGLDEDAAPMPFESLEAILRDILAYARMKGIAGESVLAGDSFLARVMGCLTPPPSSVFETFTRKYESSPTDATSWFYAFSQDTNYISRHRTARDIRWTVETEYGRMDLSINLAKPEKDPRDIAAAAGSPGGKYPKCLLCLESEGYAGRNDYPARHNHRIIPIVVNGEPWGFQYSPYVYYAEHCIAINARHTPMRIDRSAFNGLFDFLGLFPHYFVGSNADLPIVGGSILAHDHFQGGRHDFAMARAPVESRFRIGGFGGVECGTLRWPLSVLRLGGETRRELVDAAVHILEKWRTYTDAEAGILSHSGATPHNTITPIARRNGRRYELDLVLRNNRTTAEHPLGLYHPHAEYHHIKSENIGLIEVMGMAILPARLKAELEEVARCLENGAELRSSPLAAKHADWAEAITRGNRRLRGDDLMNMLYNEVGNVFVGVLECCGVFKRDVAGTQAFARFIATL